MFEQADDELLMHETGHYLTRLHEDFMPLGLHVFEQPWRRQAVDTMMASIARDPSRRSCGHQTHSRSFSSARAAVAAQCAVWSLRACCRRQRSHSQSRSATDWTELPRFGQQPDPISLGYSPGKQLARDARSRVTAAGKEAVILWASDSVRDEGAMVAFGLSLLGIQPQWNSRGIVSGLRRLPLQAADVRADIVFITSGLSSEAASTQQLDSCLAGQGCYCRPAPPGVELPLPALLPAMGNQGESKGRNLTDKSVGY